ncbi:MAG: VWA domain-containing protein [Acidiferrobacterales bacterium]
MPTQTELNEVEQLFAELTTQKNPKAGRSLRTLLPLIGLNSENTTRQRFHILLAQDGRFSRLSTGAYRLKKGSTARTSVKVPAAKPKVNRVMFVIDRSGSMNYLTNSSVKALNSNLATLRDQALKTGQRTEVSVTSFDTIVETVREVQDVVGCRDVSASEVRARGGTSLRDAIGFGIETLLRRTTNPNEDVAFLLIALTDGQENSSKQYTVSGLKQLMGSVQATDRWTLSFLLPPGSKYNFVREFGVPEGNVQEWEQSERGVQEYERSNTVGLNSFYAGRTLGLNSTKAFYTDTSSLTTKEVKQNLNDLSGQVKVIAVKSEGNIRDLVESKISGPMLKGGAFYELTKGEKNVQDYKQVLIRDRSTGKIYGGDEARDLLGLPKTNTKVIPGTHGNWDLFIQSTSVNRKLGRGTTLLYAPQFGQTFKEGPSAPRVQARKK